MSITDDFCFTKFASLGDLFDITDDCRDGGSYVMAALGNTWSHSVNTRLILQYLDDSRREVSYMIHDALNTTPFSEELKSPGTEMEQNELSHKGRHLTKQHFFPHTVVGLKEVLNIWWKLIGAAYRSWAKNAAKVCTHVTTT